MKQKPSERIYQIRKELPQPPTALTDTDLLTRWLFAVERCLDEQHEAADLDERKRIQRAMPETFGSMGRDERATQKLDYRDRQKAYLALYTIAVLARSTVGTSVDEGETLKRIEGLVEQVLTGASYDRVCEVANEAERLVQDELEGSGTRGAETLAESTRQWRIAKDKSELLRSADGDKLPEGALKRAADAIGVDLESDDEESFGKTSQAMQDAFDRYRNEESAMLACNEEIEEWIESVGMAEADQSRYQDVCDVLAKAGFPVDHANGQDAHHVVERILLERTPNPDASEYARGFEAGQNYAREAAEMDAEAAAGMAEADKRYVSEVLAKYGVQVDLAHGEDAHQLVAELCKELLQTTAVIEQNLGAGPLGIAKRLKEPK